MTESIGHTRKRIKLGYLGFVFGGFVAILPSAGVYYAASLEGRPDALTAGIIFYILMFIGFTALFYMIKGRANSNGTSRENQGPQREGNDKQGNQGNSEHLKP